MIPRPWSISAIDQFATCPRQYSEVKVYKRIPDVVGEAGLWGNRVHDASEAYLKNKTPLDPELRPYQGYLDAIKQLPGEMHVEKKMALNSQRQVVGYWDKKVWVRGKADVIAINGPIAAGLDHKTGTRKPGRQMALMALLIFYHFPEVQVVHTAFMWLKTVQRDTETYTRADIPAMWNLFVVDLQQYRDAYVTETWQPRESGLCRGWCPVTTCEFWKPKRPQKGGS